MSAMLVAAVLCAPALGRGAAGPHAAVHHQLSVRIDPGTGTIEGMDHLRIAPGLDQFTLGKGITAQRLVVDGTPVVVDPNAGTWNVGVTGSDAPHAITVEYRGVITGAEPDGTPLVQPGGTFLTGGGWYPTFETDNLSYELSVRVPPGQLAVAPGKIVSETNDSGYMARFASEGPMEEIALFAGPYRLVERHYHGRRLRTYFEPGVSDLADTYLEKTGHYIDFYEDWIGAYPYAGFDVVSGQQPLGLGFPGLTYVGAMVLRLPFMPETSLGHEVLHSWWGNAVQVDLRRGNWAEGLTTFMADYAYEERKGDAEAREMRLRWAREYAALPTQREHPLTAFISRGHTESQVVGYHKAAMLFLMLRDEIGADAFNRGVRQFWKQQKFRRASWDDLQHAFAAARRVKETSPDPSLVRSGTRTPPRGEVPHALDDFFSQWIERTGAPVLGLQDAAVHNVSSGFAVSFVLRQSQPAYRLRVPIVVQSEDGSTTQAVRLDRASGHFEFRSTQRPQRICADPDFRLFRRPLAGEVAPILRAPVFDTAAPAIIAAHDAQPAAAARALAVRLLERAPQVLEDPTALPDGTALLVGTDEEVAAVLARQHLGAPPARTAGRGSARAWAAERGGKGTLVVVSARDAAALQDASGGLPHYGSESFVVFEGRRAIDRGVWPAGPSPLCAELKAPSGH